MMFTNRLARNASIAAAAMLAATTAAPASAIGSDPSSTARAVAAKPASADPSLDKRKYCIKDYVTGSRVARTLCRTRSEWIARTGEDPVEK